MEVKIKFKTVEAALGVAGQWLWPSTTVQESTTKDLVVASLKLRHARHRKEIGLEKSLKMFSQKEN